MGKSHKNKLSEESIPTPHAQGKNIPGGVRPAKPHEIPRSFSGENNANQ